jgi:pimeloyl-ACP methyl ester carboxylesterase
VLVPSADGVRLAVHDLGGDGRPLLLSHATGFHGHVLGPLAAALSPRFHSWAIDHRGHGSSDRPATDIGDWSRFSHDVLAVSEALALEWAMGFGHSMGGTALLMAEREQPGTFAGLAVFEPIAFPADPSRPDGPSMMVEGARRRRAVFASRDEAYENYAGKPPLDELTHEALRAYVDFGFLDRPDGSVELACEPEHEARIFEGGARQDAFARLGEVDCPVLVMSGSSEENPPGLIAPAVAAALPEGRLRVLPRLSHFGPMQDPAAVAHEIVVFADEVLRPRS